MTTLSAFDARPLVAQLEDVRAAYLADERPWVLGYSGGKDSTAALHLVWRALEGVPRERRTKDVVVVASDTGVEAPMVTARLDDSLACVERAARAAALPIRTCRVTPTLEDSFWVNLIGKGYAAPSVKFRWCTERLKIRPTNRFIVEQVRASGEVILILGSRRAESATRAQVLALHRQKGGPFSRHSTLRGALIYPPIEAWSDDDVWSYLLQDPCPWGGDHRDLVALYRGARGGECPLVVDTRTSSCGGGRFGCWVCTVVERDRSMEALVDAGADWMEPLLALRDFLSSTQDPARKRELRETRRRNGRVKIARDGGHVPGPYRLKVCRDVLRRVLEAQEAVRRTGPDPTMTLISDAELHEIRRVWREERHDWEDALPGLVRAATGRAFCLSLEDTPHFSADDDAKLRAAGERHGVPVELLRALIDLERFASPHEGSEAREGALKQLLARDWWTSEDA
ncbi:DNA phosphorothioation system sulfurtransferase DndC [Deinococcus yavapaiensis]|uniref:DNA sulfur modification protein DndC n=1 Tax=Deinococcus yavapaiensis KR-236 TaxID=694435 RepID=A0A318SBH6_9DEIO|nr:DNA phosphorothioation system sulfurtransferase DndC [Deinococcus yavapaiensis]PYE54087.1 DNA sulfur modification protein DndC [Deinococcus yavapaiensis KR-236]